MRNFSRRVHLPVLALLLMNLIMGACILSVSVKSYAAEDFDLSEALQQAFDAAGWLGDRFANSLEEASRLNAEKKAEQWAKRVLGMELEDAWNKLSLLTEETPWLVRVNQTTNTVTVYRVLEVPADDEAFEKEKELLRQQIMEQDTVMTEAETESGLMQFRKLEDPDAEPVLTRTLYVPIYACPCSVGANNGTPNGIYYIQDHLRWHELVGPTWGQWCCHFAPSYLFHSLPYDRPQDPNSLQQDVYNLLGQSVSHGCVRLAAVDAKYIFDHVPTGGMVEIFVGDADDDPLGTPERPYVGEWDKTYDPTDPEYQGE